MSYMTNTKKLEIIEREKDMDETARLLIMEFGPDDITLSQFLNGIRQTHGAAPAIEVTVPWRKYLSRGDRLATHDYETGLPIPRR